MSTSSILKTLHNNNLPDPLVVIVGPTAVGKTEVALRLATRLDGEIVSADSRLFYRGMDIGTAKPSQEERVQVPHHLIDVAEPDQPWSLAIYQNEARKVIADIQGRDRLPFLVGGTGQYVRAVVEGWEIPPQEANQTLRAALEQWAAEIGAEGLHTRLAVLDPEAACNIDFRNMRRTVRALEVILQTGRLFSQQRQRSLSPYSLLMIGLNRPREELYRRIDQRIEAMLAGGFLEEVQRLVDKGYGSVLPTMSAIGYREISAVLRGEMTLDEAVVQMKRLTRRYVRQQGAWFGQHDAGIHWFQVEEGVEEAIDALIHTPQAWVPKEAKLTGSSTGKW